MKVDIILLRSVLMAVILFAAGVAADEGGIRHQTTRDLADCQTVCIDFSKADNGTILNHGDYVKDEWYKDYGMTIDASTTMGGYTPNGMARIYDTSKKGEDPDLGSPNRMCGGHGVGTAGGPEGAGPNCNPDGEGNVLIIQESDRPEPDDNAQGGTMTFSFDCPVHKMRSVGLLDVDAAEQAFFEIFKEGGGAPTIQKIVGKGDNSIQKEKFYGMKNVNQVKLVVSNSFGVRSICFCLGSCIGRIGPPLPPPPAAGCGNYDLFDQKTKTPLQGSCNAFDQVYKDLCPPVDMTVPKPQYLPPGGSSPTCKGYCCGSWGSGGTCPTSWQNTWRRAFPGVVVPICDGKEQPGKCEVVLVRKGNKDLPDTSCSVGEGNWIFPAITCWTGNDLTSEIRLGVNTKATLCRNAPNCRGGGKEYVRTESSGPKSVSFRGLTELYVECLNSDICKPVTVDFDVAADGVQLSAGDYVKDEWLFYGLSLSAKGGEKKLPRLLDTADPIDKESGTGDSDLGAPNRQCNTPGPGIGSGGRPGKPGENCSPLGNVLIIQERNDSPHISDDNASGGIITFDFSKPGGQYVYEIGLLDIDYSATSIVSYETDDGDVKEREIVVPVLGDNSKQTLKINQAKVQRIQLVLEGSGAVTFIMFCPKDQSHRLISGLVGEPGVESVEVIITDSQGVIHITTTDANGRYLQVVPFGKVTIQVDYASLSSEYIQAPNQEPISVNVPDHGIVEVPHIVLYHYECDPEKSFILFDGHDIVSSMMMGEINATWSPAFVLSIDSGRFIWCGEYTYDVFVEEGTALMNRSAEFYGTDLIDFAKEQPGVYHYETPDTTLIVKDLLNRTHSVLIVAKTKMGHYSFHRIPALVDVASVDPKLNGNFERIVDLPRPDGSFTVELTDSNIAIFRGKIPTAVTDLQVGDFVNMFTSDVDVELGRVKTKPQTTFDEASFKYAPSALSDMYDELDASVDVARAYDTDDDYDEITSDPELEEELALLCVYLDENVKRHFCMAALPGSGVVDCFDECVAVESQGRRLGWWSRAKRYARRKLRQAQAALKKFRELAKSVLEFIGNALLGNIDLSAGMTLFDIDQGATLGDGKTTDIGINFELTAKARFKIKIRILSLTAESEVRFYGEIDAESYVLLKRVSDPMPLRSKPLELFKKSHTYKFVIPPAIPAWITNELLLSSIIEASAIVESQIYASMHAGFTYEVGFTAELLPSPDFHSIHKFTPKLSISDDTSVDQRLGAATEMTTTLSWGIYFYSIFQVKLAVDLGVRALLEAGASLEAALATPDYFYTLDTFDLIFFINVYGTAAVKLDITAIIEDLTGVDVEELREDLLEKRYKLPPVSSITAGTSVLENAVKVKEAIDDLLKDLDTLIDKAVDIAAATLDVERLSDIAKSIDDRVASLPRELEKAIRKELDDFSPFDIDTNEGLLLKVDLRDVLNQVVNEIEDTEDFFIEVLEQFENESDALFVSLRDLLNGAIQAIEDYLLIIDDVQNVVDIVEQFALTLGETFEAEVKMVIEEFLSEKGFGFDVGKILDRIGFEEALDKQTNKIIESFVRPLKEKVQEIEGILDSIRSILRLASENVEYLKSNLSIVIREAADEALSTLKNVGPLVINTERIAKELETALKNAWNELFGASTGVFLDVGFSVNGLLLSIDIDNVLGQIKQGGSKLKGIMAAIRNALTEFNTAVYDLEDFQDLTFNAIDLDDILSFVGLKDEFNSARNKLKGLVGRKFKLSEKRIKFYKEEFLLLTLPEIKLVPGERLIEQDENYISLSIGYDVTTFGLKSNGVKGSRWFADFDGNLFEEASPWKLEGDTSKVATVRIPMPQTESALEAIEEYELPPNASIYLRATPTVPPLPYALYAKFSLRDLLVSAESDDCCGRDDCCGGRPDLDRPVLHGLFPKFTLKNFLGAIETDDCCGRNDCCGDPDFDTCGIRECCSDLRCYIKYVLPGHATSSTCSKSTWTCESSNTDGGPRGRITGIVFLDRNGNGVYDGANGHGDYGISGVDVVITTSEGQSFSLTTDETGTYVATVPAGVTRIDVMKSDVSAVLEYSIESIIQTAGTDPTTVFVPPGGSASDIDGYRYQPLGNAAPTVQPSA